MKCFYWLGHVLVCHLITKCQHWHWHFSVRLSMVQLSSHSCPIPSWTIQRLNKFKTSFIKAIFAASKCYSDFTYIPSVHLMKNYGFQSCGPEINFNWRRTISETSNQISLRLPVGQSIILQNNFWLTCILASMILINFMKRGGSLRRSILKLTTYKIPY